MRKKIIMVLIIMFLFSFKDNATDNFGNSFSEEEVGFKSSNLDLIGTFYKPDNLSDFPTVIIINGSGPIDRDGCYIADKSLLPPIYKNWAIKFAKNGIGVLRYDKRFINNKSINSLELSQEDQITDVISAINYLKTRLDINKEKIILVGHSEGANLASVVAERVTDVLGIVIIAGPAFAIDSLFIEQLKANPNNPESLISQAIIAFDMLRNGSFPAGGQIYGGGENYWKDWIKFSENACNIILNLERPVFVVQGDKDENFPNSMLQKNIGLWNTTALKSNLINWKVYENVTHSILKFGTQEIAFIVIDDIIDWIKSNS